MVHRLPLVLLESPFAGEVERNIGYARRALRHSISLGECPIAGHLLYTQVLDDGLPDERELGIKLHTNWLRSVDLVAVYQDYGVSPGMQYAITLAQSHGIPVEYRTLAEVE